MDYKAEFDSIFQKYQECGIVLSDEDIENMSYRYVYFSNKLEGNRLNLAQTTTLLKNNIAQGDLPLRDYLEAKGHYKALKFIISSSLNKYPLDDRILKQANKLTLEPYWSLEDAYPNSKARNQNVGEYKVVQNKIAWEYNTRKGEIIPASDPETVGKNMIETFDRFNNSKAHIIEKTAFLAYQVFIHQPFHDANKRTSRLMTTFVSMKEGLPITAFDYQEKSSNFNHALITSYLENNKSILEEFLAREFIASMGQLIERQKMLDNSKNKDLSFFI
jgi:Fic family protein